MSRSYNITIGNNDGNTSPNTWNIPDILFHIAYALWLCIVIINTSMYSRYLNPVFFNVARYACIWMAALSFVIHTKVTPRTMIGYAVALLALVCSLNSHDGVLTDSIIFIVCSKDKDFRKIAKESLVVTSVLLAIVILSSLVGLIPNLSGWSGGRNRTYLGFRYALYPADYAFLITCLTVYLKGKHFKVRYIFPLAFINLFIYFYTLSRLSSILAIFVMIGALLISRLNTKHEGSEDHRQRGRVLALVSTFSFVAMCFLSLYLVYAYGTGNQWVISLDSVDLLGGRLRASYNAIWLNGISIFGHEMHYSGAAVAASGAASAYESYNYIDNFYIKAIVNYGLVYLIIYILSMTMVMFRSYRINNYYIMIIFVAISIHCFIDNAMMYLYYNTFLFLIGKLLNSPST